MALFWQKGKKEEKPAKAEAPKKKAAPKAPKKTETKAVAVAKAPKAEKKEAAKAQRYGRNHPQYQAAKAELAKNSVVKSPRVTEKAGMLSEKGIYAFNVSKDATSAQIAKAIQEAYKVTPVKVSVAKVPSKTVFVRGKRGTTSSGKKAYVFLKKGDTIEFI